MTVSDLLKQPCNKPDNINKVVTNLLTICDKLLQDVRFLRVYHPREYDSREPRAAITQTRWPTKCIIYRPFGFTWGIRRNITLSDDISLRA